MSPFLRNGPGQVLLTSMTSAYEAQSAVSGPSFRVQLGSQLIAQGVESHLGTAWSRTAGWFFEMKNARFIGKRLGFKWAPWDLA